MENQQVPKYNYDPQTQAYAPVPEKKTNKWGIAGLIISLLALFWQIFWDTFWTVLTMGIGLFTFLI